MGGEKNRCDLLRVSKFLAHKIKTSKNISNFYLKLKKMMKKPYIKKFTEIADIQVFLVDGNYVRKNIDEEFTNYGQHYLFKFIPKNEFWIDNSREIGEEKYYIDSMLAMRRFLKSGLSHDEAVKKADAIERRERAKSIAKKKIIKIKDVEKIVEKIHKELLHNYKELKVWLIRGELVRDLFFLDFTEGGHDKVYSFVPKNEVWLEETIPKKEIKLILLHEIHERNLMIKGLSYDNAHKSASKIEFHCRNHPKELNKKLEKEIKLIPQI